MTPHTDAERLGKDLAIGAAHYRAYVGPADKFDRMSALQFNLLTNLGLREDHTLLDIGCGSLRAGKLFIPYLLPGRYCGLEPNAWLVEDGIAKELGQDLIRLKQPTFRHDADFLLSAFGRRFDFLLAQSIFSHTSQEQIRRCLAEAKKVMKPKSIFAATFVQGIENYAGDDWVYPGSVTYTVDHFQGLIREQGLVGRCLDLPHPNTQTWVAIVHPEYATQVPDVGQLATGALVQADLQTYRERLRRIEGRSYVRMGLKVHRLLRKLQVWKKKSA